MRNSAILLSDSGAPAGKARISPYTVLSVVLGLLLALAAALKTLEYLQAPPLERAGTIFLVEIQWLLAAWLLSGLFRGIAWGVALAAFASFGMISLIKALSGETSCGCFGAWKMNPWITFCMDAAAVLGLILARKGAFGHTFPKPRLRRWAMIILPLFFVGLPVGAYMMTRPAIGLSDEARTAVANVTHTTPTATSPAQPSASEPALPSRQLIADLGYVLPKSSHPISFLLTNPSSRPLKIVKIELECGCVKFPARVEAIDPYTSRTIQANFLAPDIHEPYTKHVVLFTDHPDVRPIILEVTARIGIPMRIDPADLTVQASGPGFEPEASVTVINDGDTNARILYGISSDSRLTLPAPKDPVPAGGRVVLRVNVSSESARVAPTDFTIRLHTDLAEQPVLEIHGRIQ